MIIGHIDIKLQKDFLLDPFKRSNKEGVKRFEGAEFKVEEEIEFFEVDLRKYKIGLNIGGAPIDLQHLVGWWPLNGNANDYSGNGNNGQINGVTFVSNWWQGYTPP